MKEKNENKAVFSVVGYEAQKALANEVLPPLIVAIDSEIEEEILQRAEKGLTPQAICAELNLSLDTILSKLKQCQYFKAKFAAARSEGLEALADQLIDIANNEADVLRARVKSDNIKWLLSKRKAHVYGDKLELNVNATVDIASALDEARSRASLVDTAHTVANAHTSKDLIDLLS